MSRYHFTDHPRLSLRAFMPDASGKIRPQTGGGGSAPDVPDYVGAAQATAQGNIDAAKQATAANRVNQYTPYGSSTWSNAGKTFDQAGYDKAMAAYQSQVASGANQNQTTGGTAPNGGYAIGGDGSVDASPGSAPQQSSQGTTYTPPNAADFYSGNDDNWSNTVTLSPDMQALYDQQMGISKGLFGAQNNALDQVNQSMSQPFNTASLPGAGQALNMSSLPGMGTALDINSLGKSPTALDLSTLPGMGSVLDINGLPTAGNALDINSLSQAGSVYDPTKSTNNAADQILARVNPELDRQSDSLRAQLANQGITPGSAAYQTAMSQMQQGRNDAYSQAQLQGITLGMQQQGLQFDQSGQLRNQDAALQGQQFGQQNTLRQQEATLQGQQYTQQNGLRQQEAGLQNQQFSQMTAAQQLAAALQAQQFGQQNGLRTQEAGLQNQQFNQSNTARNQSLNEQSYLRSLPLNELNALRSGSQVQMPSFGSSPQQATTSGADMLGALGAQYSAQLGGSNAASAQQSGQMGGLFGLAGTAIGGYYGAGTQTGAVGGAMMGGAAGQGLGGMFSDRRLKKNIRRIGRARNGLGIYDFEYVFGGRHVGYLAQEVEKVAPHAVSHVGHLKVVHYGMI